MVEPVVRALRDSRCFGLVAVARLEWEKFEAKSLRAVREQYDCFKDERYTRLHLDHVPVVDEDNLRVDYLRIIREAIDLGYESVMVDGSRLPLAENVAATRKVCAMAYAAGIPAEAELGAVLGHESGPLTPYEELFVSRRGFTAPDEAAMFVQHTGADWLSVAVGNIHGAISSAARSQEKVQARLNIEYLDRIRQAVGVPLVLHGGSGIRKEFILAGIRHGIAKINIGTAVRQAYEKGARHSVEAGKEATYRAVLQVIREELEADGSVSVVNPQAVGMA
jgi:ketose-bisphosphate aldolase